jgi:hypothetical protein
MAQVGEVRCARNADREGAGRGRAAGDRAVAGIVAVVFAIFVIASPASAAAQEAAPPAATTATPPASAEPIGAGPPPSAPASAAPASPPAPSVPAAVAPPASSPSPSSPPPAEASSPQEVALAEKADCTRDLHIAEDAIERDYKYARNWTDAWYVTGTSLIALNLSGMFMYHDYRVSESVVFAALSTLLMIQIPTATSSGRALQAIRASAAADPCLALANAQNIFRSNAADAADHQSAFTYIFPVVLNVLAGGIVALAERHWDFVGHGSEGLSELVGIAAGELQVLTYPRPSQKPPASGSPFQLTF